MNQHHNRMRALTSFALCLCMIATLFSGLASVIAAEAELLDGSYEGTGQGRNGDIVLRVTLADQTITAIDVVSQNETPRIWEKALALLPHIIEANSPEVDAITGATKSSEGIKAAVRDALAKADGSIPGSGTAEDPFVISTPAQLQSFAAHVDAGETAYTAASVLLGEDLDLSGINFNPIGAEGKTTAAAQAGKFFGGSFDGQDHTISGLTIAGEYETEANLGLFSALAPSARIKNLQLSGVSIQATQSGGFQNIRAGGIAGDTCKVASASDLRDAYNLIYGHHMDNGAMFGGLDAYLDSDYLLSHREGVLVSPSGVFKLEAFAVLNTDAYEKAVYETGPGRSVAEILDFLTAPGEQTTVRYFDRITARDAEKIVALSTCANATTNGRLVVFFKATLQNLITVELPSYLGVYDAKSHSETATVNYPDGTTVEYSTDGGKTYAASDPPCTCGINSAESS